MKQIIILRKDLNMPIGKAISQGCHASNMSILANNTTDNKTNILKWLMNGSKKVILSVNSLEELLTIYESLINLSIPNYLVKDKKLDTITALGVFPIREDIIDEITGHLKLY